MRRMLAVVLVSGLSVIATGAQTKAPVTRADYGQWESIGAAGPRGGFSPDGQWLAYALNRSNRNNELRFLKIADGTTKDAAFGTQPAFPPTRSGRPTPSATPRPNRNGCERSGGPSRTSWAC